MANHINPTKFFNTMRFLGNLLAVWPTKVTANKREILMQEIKWWAAFINVTGLLIPLILAIYYFRNDTLTMTKALSECTALCEIFINLIQCKMETKNFQVILHEIEYFIQNSNKDELVLFQKYINRYKNFHLFVGSSFMTNIVLFTFIPVVTLQLLPADAWYPFSVQSLPVRILLYATQAIAICQTGLGVTVDLIVAMMLWYSAMKTELLEKKVSKAMGKGELRECARSHQELIQ